MTVLYNKQILPYLIQFTDGRINNTYRYDGIKTGKTVYNAAGRQTLSERYYGNLVLSNNVPARILHADGVIELSSTFQPTYYYHLKDHLGNVRAVVSPGSNNTTVVNQTNEYYPFGMAYTKSSSSLLNPVVPNKYKYNGKEEQEMPGKWLDYGARYYDTQLGRWHSVDPLTEKSRRWSPYTYTMDNPMRFIDSDGMSASDFKDKDDNLIIHVDDGSNAVYKLDGTDHTNESFKFDGYNNQGGKDEVSVEGAVAGAQDYVTNNYDKCNQAVNFVGRTYESAAKAEGKTVDNIEVVNGNSSAGEITNDLAKKVTAEKSIASAQESAGKGNLVVGANGGHVVTMTTKTFDVTRYNTSGSVIEQKQIVGGKIANVNGSPKSTNIGPGQKNSFQSPLYKKDLIWYSLPRK